MAIPSGKKTVTLRIKVPANVVVETEIVRYHHDLPIGGIPGKLGTSGPSVLEMDLTSSKTSEWLRRKTVASSDCGNCCCVRG